MNLDRHLEAHRNLFHHLVEGDGDLQKHREFYDEYLARDGSRGRILPTNRRYRFSSATLCPTAP